MKILLPSTSSQLLKVIAREYSTAVDIVLTNEENNTSTTFSNLAASTNAGYLDIYDTWSDVVSVRNDDAFIQVQFQAEATMTINQIANSHRILWRPLKF